MKDHYNDAVSLVLPPDGLRREDLEVLQESLTAIEAWWVAKAVKVFLFGT